MDLTFDGKVEIKNDKRGHLKILFRFLWNFKFNLLNQSNTTFTTLLLLNINGKETTSPTEYKTL